MKNADDFLASLETLTVRDLFESMAKGYASRLYTTFRFNDRRAALDNLRLVAAELVHRGIDFAPLQKRAHESIVLESGETKGIPTVAVGTT